MQVYEGQSIEEGEELAPFSGRMEKPSTSLQCRCCICMQIRDARVSPSIASPSRGEACRGVV